MSENTKIVRCSCRHEYQDEKYGQGKRVANFSEREKKFRCTVCGQMRE